MQEPGFDRAASFRNEEPGFDRAASFRAERAPARRPLTHRESVARLIQRGEASHAVPPQHYAKALRLRGREEEDEVWARNIDDLMRIDSSQLASPDAHAALDLWSELNGWPRAQLEARLFGPDKWGMPPNEIIAALQHEFDPVRPRPFETPLDEYMASEEPVRQRMVEEWYATQHEYDLLRVQPLSERAGLRRLGPPNISLGENPNFRRMGHEAANWSRQIGPAAPFMARGLHYDAVENPVPEGKEAYGLLPWDDLDDEGKAFAREMFLASAYEEDRVALLRSMLPELSQGAKDILADFVDYGYMGPEAWARVPEEEKVDLHAAAMVAGAVPYDGNAMALYAMGFRQGMGNMAHGFAQAARDIGEVIGIGFYARFNPDAAAAMYKAYRMIDADTVAVRSLNRMDAEGRTLTERGLFTFSESFPMLASFLVPKVGAGRIGAALAAGAHNAKWGRAAFLADKAVLASKRAQSFSMMPMFSAVYAEIADDIGVGAMRGEGETDALTRLAFAGGGSIASVALEWLQFGLFTRGVASFTGNALTHRFGIAAFGYGAGLFAGGAVGMTFFEYMQESLEEMFSEAALTGEWQFLAAMDEMWAFMPELFVSSIAYQVTALLPAVSSARSYGRVRSEIAGSYGRSQRKLAQAHEEFDNAKEGLEKLRDTPPDGIDQDTWRALVVGLMSMRTRGERIAALEAHGLTPEAGAEVLQAIDEVARLEGEAKAAEEESKLQNHGLWTRLTRPSEEHHMPLRPDGRGFDWTNTKQLRKVREWARGVSRRLGIEVIVVEDIGQVPPEHRAAEQRARERANAAGADIASSRGFFIDGKAYIVMSEISSLAEARAVLNHEPTHARHEQHLLARRNFAQEVVDKLAAENITMDDIRAITWMSHAAHLDDLGLAEELVAKVSESIMWNRSPDDATADLWTKIRAAALGFVDSVRGIQRPSDPRAGSVVERIAAAAVYEMWSTAPAAQDRVVGGDLDPRRPAGPGEAVLSGRARHEGKGIRGIIAMQPGRVVGTAPRLREDERLAVAMSSLMRSSTLVKFWESLGVHPGITPSEKLRGVGVGGWESLIGYSVHGKFESITRADRALFRKAQGAAKWNKGAPKSVLDNPPDGIEKARWAEILEEVVPIGKKEDRIAALVAHGLTPEAAKDVVDEVVKGVKRASAAAKRAKLAAKVKAYESKYTTAKMLSLAIGWALQQDAVVVGELVDKKDDTGSVPTIPAIVIAKDPKLKTDDAMFSRDEADQIISEILQFADGATAWASGLAINVLVFDDTNSPAAQAMFADMSAVAARHGLPAPIWSNSAGELLDTQSYNDPLVQEAIEWLDTRAGRTMTEEVEEIPSGKETRRKGADDDAARSADNASARGADDDGRAQGEVEEGARSGGEDQGDAEEGPGASRPGFPVGDPRRGGPLEWLLQRFTVPLIEAVEAEGGTFDYQVWRDRNGFGAVEEALLRETLEWNRSRNRHGLVPRLRERWGLPGRAFDALVSKLSRGDAAKEARLRRRPLDRPRDEGKAILSGTKNANAPAQLEFLDELLALHSHGVLDDIDSWHFMQSHAFNSNDLPVAPHNAIKLAKPGAMADQLRGMTQGQVDDANHGFRNAQEFLRMYHAKQVTPEQTIRLFMWGFLSRGVSPYVQESMFLDAVEGAGPFLDAAANGIWSEEMAKQWEAFVDRMKIEDSPGNSTIHNLGAFGRNFLARMSEPLSETDTRPRIKVIHDHMSDPAMTGRAIRRAFVQMSEGAGIDNKVLSFVMLVTGRSDVLVLGRVQIRNLFNDGRWDDYNLYDGIKYARMGVKVGKSFTAFEDTPKIVQRDGESPYDFQQRVDQARQDYIKSRPDAEVVDADVSSLPGTGLATMTEGVKGLVLYEFLERELEPIIRREYKLLGRGDEASLGRYHWDSWVVVSDQEASHKTLDAMIAAVKGDRGAFNNTPSKQGEYGMVDFGTEYARDDQGRGYYIISYPDGTKSERLTHKQQRAAADAARKILSKSGVLVTRDKDNKPRKSPWHDDPRVDNAAITKAMREAAAAIPTEWGPPREQTRVIMPDGLVVDSMDMGISPDAKLSPAIHYGDGSVGRDTVLHRMDASRSTGHFGTGVYFLSEEAAADAREGRPRVVIDLSGLRMFRPGGVPSDAAINFHDTLREFNRLVFRREARDYDSALSNAYRTHNSLSLAIGMRRGPEVRQAMEQVATMFEQGRNDGFRTPSTYLMQALGYDGIDVRGTSADNGVYGSVVFAGGPTLVAVPAPPSGPLPTKAEAAWTIDNIRLNMAQGALAALEVAGPERLFQARSTAGLVEPGEIAATMSHGLPQAQAVRGWRGEDPGGEAVFESNGLIVVLEPAILRDGNHHALYATLTPGATGDDILAKAGPAMIAALEFAAQTGQRLEFEGADSPGYYQARMHAYASSAFRMGRADHIVLRADDAAMAFGPIDDYDLMRMGAIFHAESNFTGLVSPSAGYRMWLLKQLASVPPAEQKQMASDIFAAEEFKAAAEREGESTRANGVPPLARMSARLALDQEADYFRDAALAIAARIERGAPVTEELARKFLPSNHKDEAGKVVEMAKSFAREVSQQEWKAMFSDPKAIDKMRKARVINYYMAQLERARERAKEQGMATGHAIERVKSMVARQTDREEARLGSRAAVRGQHATLVAAKILKLKTGWQPPTLDELQQQRLDAERRREDEEDGEEEAARQRQEAEPAAEPLSIDQVFASGPVDPQELIDSIDDAVHYEMVRSGIIQPEDSGWRLRPGYTEAWRISAANILRVAAQSMTYGHSREAILESIRRMRENARTIQALKAGTKAIAESINLERMTLDRQQMFARIMEILMGPEAKRPIAKQEVSKDKFPKLRQKWLAQVKAVMLMPKEELLREIAGLEDAFARVDPPEGYDDSEGLWQWEQRLRVAAIALFGPVRLGTGTNADYAHALKTLEEFIEAGKLEILEGQEEREARAEEARRRILPAVGRATWRTRYEEPDETGQTLKEMSFKFIRGIMVLGDRLRTLNPSNDAEAAKAIEGYIHRITVAALRAEADENTHLRSLHDAVKDIYGLETDAEVANKIRDLVIPKQRLRWTSPTARARSIGALMHEYMVLEQDFYRVLATPVRLPVFDPETGEQARGDDGKLVWRYEAPNPSLHNRMKHRAAIRDEFSDADIRLMDWLRDWYAEQRAPLSRVNMAMVGLPVLTPDAMYHPAHFEIQVGGFPNQYYGLRPTISSTIPRVIHTRDLSDDADVFGIFGRRAKETAWFIHNAELAVEIREVLANAEVAKAIKDARGSHYLSQLYDHLVDALNGQNPSVLHESLIDWVRTVFVFTKLAGNIPVMVKQSASIPAFLLVDGLTPDGYWSLVPDALSKEGRQAMSDIWNHPFMQLRRRTGPDRLIRDALAVRIPEAPEGSRTGKPMEGVRWTAEMFKRLMVTNALGDAVPILLIGQAIVRSQMRKNTALGMSAEDSKARAMDLLFQIVHETQQSSMMMNQPVHYRRGGPYGRALATFSGANIMYASKEVRAAIDFYHNPRDPKVVARFMKVAAINHAFLPFAFYGLDLMFRMFVLFDVPDPKQEVQRLLVSMFAGPLAAFPLVGFTMLGIGRGLVTGTGTSPFIGDSVPVSGMARDLQLAASAAHQLATLNYSEAIDSADRLMRAGFAPYRTASTGVRNAFDRFFAEGDDQ